MVVVRYVLENEENPLYEINPTFSKIGDEEQIYYNNDNNNDNDNDNNVETEIDLTGDIIERKIKNIDKDSKEFIKEKKFIEIQKEIEKRKKHLALKRREMSSFIKKEINDYKQQQIDALERIQKYVYTMTNDYDEQLSLKIKELNMDSI